MTGELDFRVTCYPEAMFNFRIADNPEIECKVAWRERPRSSFMPRRNRFSDSNLVPRAEDYAAGWGLERRLARWSGSGGSIEGFGCDFVLHTVH
jgi:hypothetical protein